ncbi:MAG TPA: IS5 family transposase [Trueperaceae bacterium]|nr:IS5 family transposase [Trueperaceae bacterium]
MSTIATSLTQEQFKKHIRPYLRTAKRGYESKIPLFKIFNYILYKLYTGCQWSQIPIDKVEAGSEKRELSYHAVYYHFRKWSSDGSLEKVWESSIIEISADLNLSKINFDGSHAIAKKGGNLVEYQGRKKAKTSNILAVTDANGFIIASTDIIAGNHNDSYQLKSNLGSVFKSIKRLGIKIKGAFFNADKAFDTKEARKTCFNYEVIPNIAENKRNRKKAKRGRKRLFNKEVYKHRFTSERSFAWIDKFRSLLIRFERSDIYFLGAHFIAFTMINLRHVLAAQ